VEPLPHVYPFRFVDKTIVRTGPGSGRVRAAFTANGRGMMAGSLSAAVVGELIAQSALLLEGGDPGIGRSGFLAGLSELSVVRPPEPGDLVDVEVSLAGILGPVVKFQATVTDASGERLASGAVTVKKGMAT
jgi:acyl dehydratase